MRVTATYLKKWLQKEFCRLGIELIVKEGYATRFRPQDYEGGAASYIFKVGVPGNDIDATVFCFLPRHEIQEALEKGAKLYWEPRDRKWIDDSTIAYRF